MTTSIYEPVHLETRSPHSFVGEVTLSLPRALVVFGVAVLCQAWILDLPFQLDDYGLLGDPLALMSVRETEAGLTARMMRWPLVWLLALVRAVAPEPLVPWHFHVVGLALHGLAALVLARVVSRFEGHLELRGAGLAAGLLFGIAGGHVQAVSWTAAWASMLYPLLGLLSLDAFLGARAQNGSGRRLLQGGLWLYLALVCKAPAVVMAGAMYLFLLGITLGSRRGHGAGRRLVSESVAFALFGGLAALSRYLALGSLELSYYDRPSPSALDALASIPRGLVAVGQALVPWNAKPLFAGSEPLSVQLSGGQLSGPALAALGILPVMLLGLLLRARLRLPALLLVLTLAVCAVPPGLVFQGPGSNLVGRTTYLAMFVACALLGLALAGLGTPRRALGRGLLLWLVLILFDGARHVARVEGLAGEHRTRSLELVSSLAAEHGAGDTELAVLVMDDEAGYGSIPAFGPRIVTALRPPFVEAPGWEAHLFRDGFDLLERSAELDLAGRAVVVIGPELGVDGPPEAPTQGTRSEEASGEELRARRAWRLLSAPPTGFAPEPGTMAFAPPDPAQRFELLRPLQPTAARTLRLDFPARRVVAPAKDRVLGTLRVERVDGTTLAFPTSLELGDLRRATVELPLEPADLLGAAWGALRWVGRDGDLVPEGLATVAALPELEFLGVLEASELSLGSGRMPHPRLLFQLPLEATPGQRARLSWNFVTRGIRMRLFAEASVRVQDGRFEFSPKSVRLEGKNPTDFAWGEFCRRFLIPLFRQRGEPTLELECRLVLLLDEGHATARSAPFSLSFGE